MPDDKDIRCIFVCNEMLPSPCGGIGNYTFNMANAISKLGIDVTVIGLYESDLDLAIETHFKFIKVKPLNLFHQKSGMLRPGIQGFIHRRQLHNKIKSITRHFSNWVVEWPDYQGLWFNPNPLAVEVNKIHSPRFLQPFPGLPTPDFLWEARQYQKLKHYSSVSKYYAEWISKKIFRPADNIFVSYIPINTDSFKPTNTEDLSQRNRLTFCGNENPKKNPLPLAKAFSLLARKHPELTLTFAGTVVCQEPEIRQCIAEEFQDRVEFRGLLAPSEIVKLLNQTSIFCLPSEHESFGMAWVEAMACGVPVIAGAGSCAEEVVTTDAGLIVDPHDSYQIAQAISSLLDNPDLCREMGQKGQKIVSERYSANAVAQRVVEWYLSLLDKRSPRKNN